MKLTAVAQAVSAAAERLNIAVSAQEKRMAAGIVASPMVLAYEIGQWILRVNKLDPITVSDGTSTLDEMFLAFFKTKTDNVLLADEIAQEFRKALRDEAGLSDAQVMDFFKSLADQMAVSEAHEVHLTKPLAEVSQAVDEAVLAFYKALVELVGIDDAEAMAFGKPLGDLFVVSSGSFWDVNKENFDQASLVEAHAYFLSKAIRDQVIATDDFDGAASTNDDQTMIFTKNVIDLAGAVDFFNRLTSYVRAFEDSALVSDESVHGFGKSIEDVSLATEALRTQFAKPLEDLYEVFDAQSYEFSRTRNELAYVNNAFGKVPGKVVYEVQLITDGRRLFNTTKKESESLSVQELISKSFARPPNQELIAVTQQALKSLSLVKQESALTTDGGSIRSQGYCDFSYFAEDFVGASRTF